ncbi:MAG: MMPL family transporter, partial [Solirubrobacteraceae bacterium]
MKTVLVHERPAPGAKQSRPAQRRPNLAGRIGRWSAAHWKTATFGWLGLVLVAFAVGNVVGTKQADPTKAGPGQSGRMDRILDAGFKVPASESVLIQSQAARAGSPAFDAAVKDVVSRLATVPAVQNVRSPLEPANAAQIAKGRHAALVEFDIRGDSTKAMDKLSPVLKGVANAQRAHPDFFVGEFGGASAAKAVNTAFAHDLKSAGVFSIPLTLIILVIAFGALVAAGIPLLLALTAVFATFGLAALPSHLLPIAPEAFAVVLLVGLAVGVDYSMFYLRREREKRAAGRSERAALEAAAATSGRSVLISGLTVMVAVAGMFLAGTSDFRGIAMGTILVVATSVIGSLTVLPALLSKLGDRIEKGRIPFISRKTNHTGESRFWSTVVDAVLRRPVVSAVSATALLVLLALPLFRMHTILPSYGDYPRSMPILQTLDRIQQAFPAGPTQAEVVVRTSDVGSASFAKTVTRFRAAAVATHQAYNPITVQPMDEHTALISVPLAGDGGNAASTSAVATLRNRVIPATLAGAPGIEQVAVGGTTAWAVDYNATMRSHVGFVFAFVLALAFLLLLVTFRSVVVALKAIVLNLLSVGAAYGFIVAVFQWGWGEHILG